MGLNSSNGYSGPYELQPDSRSNSLCLQSSAQLPLQYCKAQPGYDYGPGSHTSSLSRNTYLPGYQFAYDDESAGYTMPSQSYNDITAANASYAESSSFGVSNFPLMSQHLPRTSASNDMPHAFPVMPSLSSKISGTDRTLPTPTTCRNTCADNSTSSMSVAESMSDVPLNYRPTRNTALEGISSGSIQSPRTSSSGTICSNSSVNGKVVSPNPREMGFGCIPLSNSPPLATNCSVPFAMADAGGLAGDFHTESEFYGHGSETFGRRSNQESSPSYGRLLSNGAIYTPLPQRNVDNPTIRVLPGPRDLTTEKTALASVENGRNF